MAETKQDPVLNWLLQNRHKIDLSQGSEQSHQESWELLTIHADGNLESAYQYLKKIFGSAVKKWSSSVGITYYSRMDGELIYDYREHELIKALMS